MLSEPSTPELRAQRAAYSRKWREKRRGGPARPHGSRPPIGTPEFRAHRAAQAREWRLAHPGYNKDRYGSKHHLRAKYGISPFQHEIMMLCQGGTCAICGDPAEKLDVDHDHSTGRVRGLLCKTCNLHVGFHESRPGRLGSMLEYLAVA